MLLYCYPYQDNNTFPVLSSHTILAGCMQEGGGDHSDAYSVQEGGRWGLKIGEICVCN